MSENKRYYWIKLKTDFFNQETIDFMLSQENGFQYVVLYQMLCLQAANNNGELSSKIGEVIIPYDANKITRDTKHFSYDTVLVALDLFKKLGLIYEEDNKILKISDFDEMVGSEVSSAKRVREFRERQKALQCNTNVTQEIEYRDKSIDIDNKKEIDNNKLLSTKKKKDFTPPTLEEVEQYCKDRENNVDANKFINHYTSNGWKVGKVSMKDWKAAVRTWETNSNQQPKKETEEEWFERMEREAKEMEKNGYKRS